MQMDQQPSSSPKEKESMKIPEKSKATLGRSRKKKAAPQPPTTIATNTERKNSTSAESGTSSSTTATTTTKSASSGKKTKVVGTTTKVTKAAPDEDGFLAFKVRVRAKMHQSFIAVSVCLTITALVIEKKSEGHACKLSFCCIKEPFFATKDPTFFLCE